MTELRFNNTGARLCCISCREQLGADARNGHTWVSLEEISHLSFISTYTGFRGGWSSLQMSDVKRQKLNTLKQYVNIDQTWQTAPILIHKGNIQRQHSACCVWSTVIVILYCLLWMYYYQSLYKPTDNSFWRRVVSYLILHPPSSVTWLRSGHYIPPAPIVCPNYPQLPALITLIMVSGPVRATSLH